MTNTNVEIAAAILAARSSGTRISKTEQAARSLNLTDGYEIQSRVISGCSPVGGWKIGAKNSTTVPFWAPILAQDILPSGTDLGRPSSVLVGVEIEVAFRLGADIANDEIRRTDPSKVFTSAHLVIEYVESRLEAPDDAEFCWKIADNLINGGLIIGDVIADWQHVGVDSPNVLLKIDGQTTIEEQRYNGGGHPLRLLHWGADEGVGHCGGFLAGQVVTTGSLTGIQWYPGGTAIAAELPELGVSASLTL